MDKTCKTCKWWGDEYGSKRFCENEYLDGELMRKDAGLDKYPISHGEQDGVATGPDFGCIHHETKE